LTSKISSVYVFQSFFADEPLISSAPASLARKFNLLTLSDIEEEYGIDGYTWAPVSSTDQVEAAQSNNSKSPSQVKTPGVTKYSTSSQNLNSTLSSHSDGRVAGSRLYSVSSGSTRVYREHEMEPSMVKNASLSNLSYNIKEGIDHVESEATNIRSPTKSLHKIHAIILPFRDLQDGGTPEHDSTSPICKDMEGPDYVGKVCDIDKSHSFKVAIKEGEMGSAESPVKVDSSRSDSSTSPSGSPRRRAVDTVVGAGSWILEEEEALSALDPELFFELSSEAKIDDNENFQFDRGWRSSLRNHAGQSSGKKSGSNNISANQSNSESTASGGSASKGDGQSQKRSHRGQRGRSDDDGDQDEDQEQDDFKKPKIEKFLGKRFACPFWKHHPQFSKTSPEHGKRFMVCTAGIGFTDIARLKYVGNLLPSVEVSTHHNLLENI
jgi:hypothetical protein